MAKKILLADDSITIQKVISITFSNEDYELTIVGDGDSALRKINELRPDLVMADVAMPGKTGYEVCEAVKKDPALKNTPVLLLAGTFEPLSKDDAVRAGADDSIIKPFESQELLEKVKELLAKGAALKPAGPAPKAAPAAPPQARKEPAPAEDIWEAGDFLGFNEEPEPTFKEIKGAETAPDLDFLSGGLFEEPEKEAKASGPGEFVIPREKDFMDLEFHEEEFKAPEEKKPPPVKSEPFKAVTPEPFDFAAFEPEPVKTPKEEKPFEAEPIEAFEAPEKPFWAEFKEPHEEAPAHEAAQFLEPELIEPPPMVEEPQEVFEEAPAKPLEPEAAPRIETVPIREIVEPRVSAAAEVAEKAVERVEARVRQEARIEATQLPKAEVEEIVKKLAREIVEEVAWEVVPEIAEELIKAEINRVKEVLGRK